MSENADSAEKSQEQAGEEETSPVETIKNSGKARRQFCIDVFRDWCKSCGICAAFCPRQCIGMTEEGYPCVVDCDRCTGCGWCELHCPDFAISVRSTNAKKLNEEID